MELLAEEGREEEAESGGGFGQRRSSRPRPLLSFADFTEAFYTSRPEVLYRDLHAYLLDEEELDRQGYPRLSPEHPSEAFFQRLPMSSGEPRLIFLPDEETRRNCCRCGLPFRLNEPLQPEPDEPLCRYHFGHLHGAAQSHRPSAASQKRETAEAHRHRQRSRSHSQSQSLPHSDSAPGALAAAEKIWDCCEGREGSPGCVTALHHVTDALRDADRQGYVSSRPLRSGSESESGSGSGSVSGGGSARVLALDCEMVYTRMGLDLARVTLVEVGGRLVYDRLVRPAYTILDCNTRFSGLQPRHFHGLTTALQNVQSELLSIVSEETILVGHSLETDLRALKFSHSKVVDTALVFPHRRGRFYKRSLRSLAWEYLGRRIQDDGARGHSSLEDAETALQLVLWRLRENLRLPLFHL